MRSNIVQEKEQQQQKREKKILHKYISPRIITLSQKVLDRPNLLKIGFMYEIVTPTYH